MVTVARCANAAEAELYAGALADAGIPAHVLNRNTNALGAYVGAADVEVQVLESDAGRARELLNAVQNPDELEPADEADDPPPADDEGRPLALEVVAAFEHAGAMRDAATILAAANVRAYTPRLVPRGDRPPGEGKRFVLRVQEDDADRARSVLEAAAEEDAAEGGAEDEPRCPKCRSWRSLPHRQRRAAGHRKALRKTRCAGGFRVPGVRAPGGEGEVPGGARAATNEGKRVPHEPFRPAAIP